MRYTIIGRSCAKSIFVTFPDDDNGDVLRRLLSDGDDLTRPRDVDFTVVFADENSVQDFANHFRNLEYAVSVEMTQTAEGLPWDARVVKHMVPSYEAIREFEELLESIAIPLGGRNDGWGCIAQNDAALNPKK
jgi:Regulator of ribonuclease activity B